MGRINVDAINTIAVSHLRSIVPMWLPGGTLKGCEYVVINPTRPDKSSGSFSINVDTGEYSDFAIGIVGMGAVYLYAYITGTKLVSAAREVMRQLHISEDQVADKSQSTKTQPQKSKWTTITPVPSNAPQIPSVYTRKENNEWKKFPILYHWEYRDNSGNLLGYDVRFNNSDGHKEVLPLTYCKNNDTGETKWKFLSFKIKRPLYGMNVVALNPDATVIVTEGCKKAKALQALLDSSSNKDFVVVAWPGGCNSAKHANWKLLKGKKVYIWPDNDRKHYEDNHPNAGQEMPKEEQGGWKAAVLIYKELKSECDIVKLIDVPGQSKPDTWDVADAIDVDKWNLQDILNYIENNLIDYKEVMPQAQVKFVIKCLGYSSGCLHYWTSMTKRILSIPERSHTPQALFYLAPLEYWQALFPSVKHSVDWLAAASFLITDPDSGRAYDPNKHRGRGAHIDNGRAVFHFGEKLLVDNKLIDNLELENSQFIYEKGVVINDDISKPLSDAESCKLLEIIEKLNFKEETQALLLAGFIALAPICGALYWRPHIWITGGKGTGKSTVINKILKPCIGDFCLQIASDSTAAGIRQSLRYDSKPVLFDEAEGQNEKAKANIQAVLELARGSSSGVNTLKGSSSHEAKEFHTNSMFTFASIGVNISEDADESRISLIELVIPKNVTQEQLDKNWSLLEAEINRTLTPAYCSALRARSILTIATIRENCKLFTNFISNHFGNRRAGDQLGSLFAGAYSLCHSGVITESELFDFIGKFNIEKVYEKTIDSEIKLLDTILQHIIQIGPGQNLSIEEMVLKIIQKPESFDSSPDDTQMKYYDILKRTGIRVDSLKNDRTKFMIWISDSHNGIKQILEKTSWPKKWGILLSRIEGAERSPNMRFTGGLTRATGVPAQQVFKE